PTRRHRICTRAARACLTASTRCLSMLVTSLAPRYSTEARSLRRQVHGRSDAGRVTHSELRRKCDRLGHSSTFLSAESSILLVSCSESNMRAMPMAYSQLCGAARDYVEESRKSLMEQWKSVRRSTGHAIIQICFVRNSAHRGRGPILRIMLWAHSITDLVSGV